MVQRNSSEIKSKAFKSFGFILLMFIMQTFLSSSLVFSLSVLPSEKVYYVNNQSEFKGSFIVFDSVDENNVVTISFNDSLSKYLSLDKTILSFKSGDSKQKIGYVLSLGDLLKKPGQHEFPITFTQKILSDQQGISAQISVVAKIIAIIPYPDRFVDLDQNLNDKEITLLISNKGEELQNCSLNANIFDLNANQLIMQKTFKLDNLRQHEQKSFVIDLKNITLPSQILVESVLKCNDFLSNKTKLVEIPRFPYNITLSIANINDKGDSLEVLATFKNILTEKVEQKRVLYFVESDGKKSKVFNFYLPELNPFEERTTTLLVPLFSKNQNNLSITFYVNQNNKLISETKTLFLEQPKPPSYKLVVYILFLIVVVIIASLKAKPLLSKS